MIEEKRTHFKGFVGLHQVFQHTHFFLELREEITFEEIMAENFLTGEGNRCLDSENPENHK